MFVEEFEPLTPAEKQLLAEMGTGELVLIGDGTRPGRGAGEDRILRAAFLRALFLGQIEDLAKHGARLHEKGLRIAGARVTGWLDLEGCRIPRDIALANCQIDEIPVLRSAELDNLFLNGSALPGLWGDRLTTRGAVFMIGAEVTGEVRFSGAKLGGDLYCDGAELTGGKDSVALLADGLETRGPVFLRGAKVTGGVRLLGAKIAGDLECAGAKLTGGSKKALDFSGARIAGAFFLRLGAKVDGVLDMTAVEIDVIHDEKGSWPAPGKLLLDRCIYGAFTGKDIDARARVKWLSLQDEARWDYDFWPQPWEQLAKVLREMGHRSDARAVLIEKEKRQRKVTRTRLKRDHLFEQAIWLWDGVWDRLLRWTVRYGHAPLLAFVWLAGMAILGFSVFTTAEAQGAIKPNQPVVLRSAEWVDCAGKDAPSRLACFLEQPAAQSYPQFNAFIYSLDTLLPIVDLEMQGYWIPDDRVPGWGKSARAYLWAHIALGWALSLLAVAGFSGLIRSDK